MGGDLSSLGQGRGKTTMKNKRKGHDVSLIWKVLSNIKLIKKKCVFCKNKIADKNYSHSGSSEGRF